MSAYIKNLTEASTTGQSESQSSRSGKNPRDSLKRWHMLLPAELQQRPYTMDEFVRIFRASPMELGKALAELGWIRKRNYRGSGSHSRYWLPPP